LLIVNLQLQIELQEFYLKFSELKKYIAEGLKDTFFLLEGEDGWFREKAADMIVNSAVTCYPEINFVRLKQPSAAEIEESLSVLPFLSEKRALLVKEYYPAPAEAEKLKNSVHLKGGNVLIISNSQKNSLLNKIGEICRVDCAKEEPYVLKNWIKTILKNEGMEINSDASEKLALYCGQDMVKISNEIKKLSMLGKAEITPEDIEENVSKDTEYQAYMLTSATTQKSGEVYNIIKDFTSKGDAGSSGALLGSLYSGYKRMFYAKDCLISNQALSELLEVKPYAVTMSGKAAAKYKKKELKNALNMINDCEYKIKSGNMDADTALYYSVTSLMKF
jgi:DNA polymerase III delta subunit